MDPDSGTESQRALSLQWKSYKLVQDPAIRRVTQKIYRYDGVHFSVPDPEFHPVGNLQDPRPRRIWSRYTELSLPVPKFKLDEFYIGQIPLKEVTFARLNDNIKEPFLAEMCAKFGEVEEMEILFHPKTRKHLGLARVLFTSTRGAKDTVKQLHNTSVMGNIIHAQLDIKGQQRQKIYDLLVSGAFTPQTVPLGGKALTERLPTSQPVTQPDTSSDIRRRLSSELVVQAAAMPAPAPGSVTPCSSEPGFSEQRLETPPPLHTGPFTPASSASSQGGGTPYSSRSGTPFSQDSGYAAGGRHAGYTAGALGSGYPPQDMLPSSSSSSAVTSSVGGYKVSRYPEEPQEPSGYLRGRPMYPPYRHNEPPCYPMYPNAGPPPGGPHHLSMPPPASAQYEAPPAAAAAADREREREAGGGGRYGAGGRRSSFHQQDTNSSSSSSSSSKHHSSSHHSERREERREERSYRRDSLGSRSGEPPGHQRHRNHHHHHSHNHHGAAGRRRSSHERDRERDAEFGGPRHNASAAYRSSSNSMSPPPSSYPAYPASSKEPGAAAPLEPPPHSAAAAASRLGGGGVERGSLPGSGDKDYHGGPVPTPTPPPAPPPLPPASVIAAAVAETLGSLDFGRDSPPREEQWSKPKRRPSTPPAAPPKTPPAPPGSPPLPPPPHSSVASSSTSPSSTSLPHQGQLPSPSVGSPPPPRGDGSSSPEPDSTNESLPFVYHSSSLDSRIEMLLKEQKAKFSFLASDEEEEGEERQKAAAAAAAGGGAGEGDGGEQQRRKGEGRRGRKPGKGGDGRKSPPVIAAAMPSSSSSTYSPHLPSSDDPQAGLPGAAGATQEEGPQPGTTEPQRVGARTPPYNGQSQSSPHSSGEDMEISDEDEAASAITTATGHQPAGSRASSPSQSSQAAQRGGDPSASPPPLSDPQHFGSSMHPSYPPHLPPGYALPPPHMELHPEYPPPMPPHMYDYASSVELMSQYSGGPPMSFQMQTQMLSRLHQLRVSSSGAPPGEEATPPGDYPPSSYHHHAMPPHLPYMAEDGGGAGGNGGAGTHYDPEHHYMPPHMAPYSYPDPHASQLPPLPPHHGIPQPPPPPHAGWPPHVLPPHYPSYLAPPPGYGTMPPGEEQEYGAPGDEPPLLTESPHEATVQLALATLIQEMKNIMQRDLNRKMVENIAFATFDEWWERKETKAKPFQTMVRGVSALRDEEKKEEKTASRPRDPLVSLVDWAKSGGVEGFALRGPLRLPSFKVKRKEPQELDEEDMKRPRPSTPPDEDDEGAENRHSDRERHGGPERGSSSKSRKRKPRNRKPWELDSEGEETSDGSSSEKEEGESGKESEDDALSADSDDESLSSSSGGSSSSTSSSGSSSEDEDEEEEGERLDSEGLDTMDETTLDGTPTDRHKDADGRESSSATVSKAGERPASRETKPSGPSKRPPSPPYPRPSSPVVLLPPLKKRRKAVSFSTEDPDVKPPPPPTAPLPSRSPQQGAADSPLLSPPRPPDSPLSAAAAGATPGATPPSHVGPAVQLLPFASKPGEGNALTVPPHSRNAASPEDHRKPPAPLGSPQRSPGKLPWKRGKESPKSPVAPPPAAAAAPPPVMVCLTVQNLPPDHASMCRMAYEEAPPPPPVKRGRGRSPAAQRAPGEEDEGQLRLREQLGVSSLLQLATAPPGAPLADAALKADPEAGDSEETETSDEAEEQRMDEELFLSPEPLTLVMDAEGVVVLTEHNYSKPPVLLAPAPRRSSASLKQDHAPLLPAELAAISGVLEAPEEVIGEAPRGGDGGGGGDDELSSSGPLYEARDAVAKATALTPPHKRKGAAAKGLEAEKDKSKKRRRKEKPERKPAKKGQKERPGKKQRKGKLADSEEDVDVEELESGELSSSSEDDELEDVRKSERLFLQEAGVTTSSQRKTGPPTPTAAGGPLTPALPLVPVSFDTRSEYEQMTILYDIWNSGLDTEDLLLLKTTYEKLLQEDHRTDWLNDTHWVGHTTTNLPNPRRKKKSVERLLREHVTGCARSEGYYAISRKEKDAYLDLDLPEQVLLEMENLDSMGTNRLLSERRSEQRRLLTAIGTPAVMDSDLLKLNQLKFRKKKLRFGRSRIHEWGLFAMEAIAADEMVIEYVGQNIRQMVADNREKRYAQQGIGSSYLFRVDHDTIIDATKCGNLARFINHCCTPNCYAKVITIESQKKIVIYSKQAIAVNEEITYDYKFPLEDNKIPCLCGTENCRGTLN